MKFIIPILVGATIGYITNWLAIKMLFRPYERKEVLGVHIPFTPGLIPKERERIANSVGKTIGEYLLSPKIIIEALSNNRVDEHIRLWVELNINKLKEEDRTIKDLILNLDYENFDELLSLWKEKFTNFICTKLREDKFQKKMMNLIEEYILGRTDKELYTIIGERLEQFLHSLSTSDELRLGLKNAIDNKLNQLSNDERILYEVIPDEVIHKFKDFINEHSEDIGNKLYDILKDPVIETRIKKSITSIASQNLSKVITMFMSPEMIADKVFKIITEYFNKPEMNNNIILVISSIIDKILESKVSSLTTNISSKINEEEISKISNLILGYISNEESQRKILDIIDEKIRLQESSIKKGILNFLSEEFNTIVNSEAVYNNIYSAVHDSLETIITMPISSIVKNADEDTITNIFNLSKVIFNDFVENRLPHIVELFNISKVVEDQINSFDVAFAEELIIEIAHKELKAITWLGALLGGIMGIISPLLQMI